MCFRKNKPVRLEKKESVKINISPEIVALFIMFIIVFTIAIILAIGCTSPYNMAWA